MVRECIVNTAAVNVKILAQILQADTGALNVPAGITNTPGRIPFERLVFKLTLGKPQHKIVLITLIGILLNAFTHTNGQVLFVMVIENIIAFQLGSIKVYIASGNIGKTLFQQTFHDLDKFRNAAGCRLNDLRFLDV